MKTSIHHQFLGMPLFVQNHESKLFSYEEGILGADIGICFANMRSFHGGTFLRKLHWDSVHYLDLDSLSHYQLRLLYFLHPEHAFHRAFHDAAVHTFHH